MMTTLKNLAGKWGKEPESETFPSTIAGFGYKFTDKGELRNEKTGARFEFNVRPNDAGYNQRHYEALGETITEHVYKLLEEDCELVRVNLPLNAADGDPVSFIFRSTDFFTNKDKLLVLIHGTGVVRAGQWARRLIINENLDWGTQIPYIKRAMREGYAVIVLNTNRNRAQDASGVMSPIKGNTTPENHARYVWDNLVQQSPAQKVYVVAHSYGGHVVFSLVTGFVSAVERITKIAFTDSAHNLHSLNEKTLLWVQERTINWVTSHRPLGDDLTVSSRKGLNTVSAGVLAHEATSQSAFDAVFNFFSMPSVSDLDKEKADSAGSEHVSIEKSLLEKGNSPCDNYKNDDQSSALSVKDEVTAGEQTSEAAADGDKSSASSVKDEVTASEQTSKAAADGDKSSALSVKDEVTASEQTSKAAADGDKSSALSVKDEVTASEQTSEAAADGDKSSALSVKDEVTASEQTSEAAADGDKSSALSVKDEVTASEQTSEAAADGDKSSALSVKDEVTASEQTSKAAADGDKSSALSVKDEVTASE